jgi:hypothetical protein
MRLKNFHVRPKSRMSPSPKRLISLLLFIAYLPK